MLTNAIDMHIHTAPDGIPRSVRDIEAARLAAEAGMRGIMLKNHLTPTYGRAAAAQDAVPGILVFGGVALNAHVGGINPAAVEAACSMGAKCVWLPTASSEQHIRHFKAKGVPVPVFDGAGKPVAGLMDVLALVAKADIILATGHLAPGESRKVLGLARQAGVKKLVVTHPEFEAVAMPVAMQQELAREGVFFERCFYATNSPQQLPVQAVAADIQAVGWQSTVLASDFGQEYNTRPVQGLQRFVRELAHCGIAQKELRAMITDHPAGLLGL